jgi:hypothetical protein
VISASSSVAVSVVKIGIMRMCVHESLMTVRVRVRYTIGHRWIIGSMLMLMVIIVDVRVIVVHFFVDMLVFVAFCEMEPDSNDHAHGAGRKQQCRPFTPDDYRQRGSHEGRKREIRAGSGCTEMS